MQRSPCSSGRATRARTLFRVSQAGSATPRAARPARAISGSWVTGMRPIEPAPMGTRRSGPSVPSSLPALADQVKAGGLARALGPHRARVAEVAGAHEPDCARGRRRSPRDRSRPGWPEWVEVTAGWRLDCSWRSPFRIAVYITTFRESRNIVTDSGAGRGPFSLLAGGRKPLGEPLPHRRGRGRYRSISSPRSTASSRSSSGRPSGRRWPPSSACGRCWPRPAWAGWSRGPAATAAVARTRSSGPRLAPGARRSPARALRVQRLLGDPDLARLGLPDPRRGSRVPAGSSPSPPGSARPRSSWRWSGPGARWTTVRPVEGPGRGAGAGPEWKGREAPRPAERAGRSGLPGGLRGPERRVVAVDATSPGTSPEPAPAAPRARRCARGKSFRS